MLPAPPPQVLGPGREDTAQPAGVSINNPKIHLQPSQAVGPTSDSRESGTEASSYQKQVMSPSQEAPSKGSEETPEGFIQEQRPTHNVSSTPGINAMDGSRPENSEEFFRGHGGIQIPQKSDFDGFSGQFQRQNDGEPQNSSSTSLGSGPILLREEYVRRTQLVPDAAVLRNAPYIRALQPRYLNKTKLLQKQPGSHHSQTYAT